MDQELMNRVVAIMDACAKNDELLRQAWTGDVSSVASAEVKTIRIMRIEADYRKREHRTVKNPASEPLFPQSEPWSINDWNYLSDWLEMTGGDESDWEKAEVFWKKCDTCDGKRKEDCPRCGGSGKCTCHSCGGTGWI